jgi:hypothetical protein
MHFSKGQGAVCFTLNHRLLTVVAAALPCRHVHPHPGSVHAKANMPLSCQVLLSLQYIHAFLSCTSALMDMGTHTQ